jgi:hypothetical protein
MFENNVDRKKSKTLHHAKLHAQALAKKRFVVTYVYDAEGDTVAKFDFRGQDVTHTLGA